MQNIFRFYILSNTYWKIVQNKRHYLRTRFWIDVTEIQITLFKLLIGKLDFSI